MAKAQPTSTLMAIPLTARATNVTASPAPIAEKRNERTPLPSRSCDSAPAIEISSPEEVERKAAKAPAAVRADRTMPAHARDRQPR